MQNMDNTNSEVEGLEQVVVRDIRVHYGFYDEFQTKDRFTVLADEADEYVHYIINLVDQYHFPTWGINLSRDYLAEERFVWNKEQITEYLLTNIEATIDQEKALKLTKK